MFNQGFMFEILCLCLRYPVDTGRKLNVHKTFRRRPRRLRNVLGMFKLHPVSTEYYAAYLC